MKPIKGEIATMRDFEKAEEKLPKGQGKGIVPILLESLGERPVGTFELSWTEYSGLRRHILRAEDEKKPALLKAKVLDFEGAGQKRTYKVAIAKVGEKS